jgi:PBSX family phage terminase large subunit
MVLHQAQATILQDQHRFRVLVCGRKFGKTTLAAEEILGCAISNSGRRVLYIAPTKLDAKRLMWDRLKGKLGKSIIREDGTRLEFTIKTVDNGKSDIFLGSWEVFDSYRGDEFDLIVFDEVQDYKNFWIGWMEAMRPTLTPRRGVALFMGTPKGFTHLYDLYNFGETKKDFASFKYTTYDNPYIPVDEIEQARVDLPDEKFEQEYLASFMKTQGLVYQQFNREKHVTTENPKTSIETILGIDFGYTNPAAIIPIKVDGDSHYWIREEWYKSGQTTEQIAEQARLYRSTKCYPDPAEPDRIAILSKYGLNCREVSKDIVAGVDHVRELFKQGRIHIHPDCKNLIMELETYRYPDKKPDANEVEKPVKENDHALDALRYALYTNKPIIKRNDPVFEQFGTHYIEG